MLSFSNYVERHAQSLFHALQSCPAKLHQTLPALNISQVMKAYCKAVPRQGSKEDGPHKKGHKVNSFTVTDVLMDSIRVAPYTSTGRVEEEEDDVEDLDILEPEDEDDDLGSVSRMSSARLSRKQKRTVNVSMC